MFLVPVPDDGFQWPDGCCVCGAEATRTLRVSVDASETASKVAYTLANAALGKAAIATGGGGTASVDVPHCDIHDDGAGLSKSFAGYALSFRSYAFQQSFARLNHGLRGR